MVHYHVPYIPFLGVHHYPLVPLSPQSIGKEEGNVHSGATPPWLKDDDDALEEGVPVLIGPSEEEFLMHSEPAVCMTLDLQVVD